MLRINGLGTIGLPLNGREANVLEKYARGGSDSEDVKNRAERDAEFAHEIDATQVTLSRRISWLCTD